MDTPPKKPRRKYAAPVIAALVVALLMAGYLALVVWAMTLGLPWWALLLLGGGPLAVIIGVIAALIQRLKQIKGGEEDAAAQY